jgi:DNA polymerase-1
MLRAHAALSDMRTKLVLTVHDELLFEAPDDEVEAAKKIVLCEMEGAYELEPPLEVDVGVGVNWTDAK